MFLRCHRELPQNIRTMEVLCSNYFGAPALYFSIILIPFYSSGIIEISPVLKTTWHSILLLSCPFPFRCSIKMYVQILQNAWSNIGNRNLCNSSSLILDYPLRIIWLFPLITHYTSSHTSFISLYTKTFTIKIVLLCFWSACDPTKLSFAAFLAHSICYSLLDRIQRSIWGIFLSSNI